MDRNTINYNNQIYNNHQFPNGQISNRVHRGLPSHLSTARYHYNNIGTGVMGMGHQSQTGFYPLNQPNPAPRYRNGNNGIGTTFVAPNNSRSEKDDIINDEEFSEKLISYARFNRNTDLIKTILSEVMVPDVRQVVTTTRLQVLKDQVRTLEDHHKKVDIDVKMMEQDYANKKRKFIDSTAEYHSDYKKLCRPAVGLQMYHGMVAKYYNYMKQHAEKQRWENTLAWAQQTAAGTLPAAPVINSNPSALPKILEDGPSTSTSVVGGISYFGMIPKGGEGKKVN